MSIVLALSKIDASVSKTWLGQTSHKRQDLANTFGSCLDSLWVAGVHVHQELPIDHEQWIRTNVHRSSNGLCASLEWEIVLVSTRFNARFVAAE